MKTHIIGFLAALCAVALVTASCAMEEHDDDPVGTVEQGLALDTAHRRVIQECSQAMWGSWWIHNEEDWPVGTTYATHAYTSADVGAWNKLLANYGRYKKDDLGNSVYQPAYFVSCLYQAGTQYYSPCYLTAYGSSQMPGYTCQGNCSIDYKRGGQCKPFANLVAYRSGTYQNSSYGFRVFPSDQCITYTSATCTLPEYKVDGTRNWVLRPSNDADMPLATYANIVPGDYLRRTYGHALLVVRKISSSQVIVLDSNWLNGGSNYGNGKEIVGSHTMAFTGSGGDSDLGAYRVLKCAYTGKC